MAAGRSVVVVARCGASVVRTAFSAASSFSRSFGAYFNTYRLASYFRPVDSASGVFGIARLVEYNELTTDEKRREGTERDGERREEKREEKGRDETDE